MTNISTDQGGQIAPDVSNYKGNVHKLYSFLNKEISLKVVDQPPRIRKLVKFTRAVLEKPPIVLANQ
jgi:hypothetical protein